MSLTIEDSRKKFREKYPEIDEVVEIVKEIDENNVPVKLKDARKIKEWIEKSENANFLKISLSFSKYCYTLFKVVENGGTNNVKNIKTFYDASAHGRLLSKG